MKIQRVLYLIDANPKAEKYNKMKLGYKNILQNLTPEERLSVIANASYVIPDSYHGICFLLIFQKNFLGIKNRESERFETFCSWGNLADKIVSSQAVISKEAILEVLDYEVFNNVIAEEKIFSKQWLCSQIGA